MKYIFCLSLMSVCFVQAYVRFEHPQEALQIAAQYLPRNPVVVEAGAYNGNDTVFMAQFWPQATIHSFEPIPRIYQALAERTRHCSNVRTYSCAVSDKNSIATMYVSEDVRNPGVPSQSSSLLQPKEHLKQYPHVTFPHVIMVPALTFDSWAERNKVDHVDFMWLDMQGYELHALKASPRIMSTVKAILIEIEVPDAYAGQPTGQEVYNWLTEQGFEVVAMNCDTLSLWFDVLFVRTK